MDEQSEIIMYLLIQIRMQKAVITELFLLDEGLAGIELPRPPEFNPPVRIQERIEQLGYRPKI